MPDINPLTNNQIFLKKIAENTGSDYETGDVSEINPLTIDQIFLKEIAANTAGQSGDITELEEKVSANTAAIEVIENVTGAKNLLPFDLASIKANSDNIGSWSNNVYSLNGANCTVNDDGTITVDTNGTGTSGDVVFYVSPPFSLSGDYILSGCISGGGSSTYRLSLMKSDYTEVAADTGAGAEVTLNANETYYLRLIIIGGTTITNAIFKPMIRPAGTDATYVPYAMTNRELTESVTWHHIGYGSDDGGEVSCSLNYSEFIFTMITEGTNILQTIVIPVDQTGHQIYIMAYQSNTYNTQTRIAYDYSNSKFTFSREFLNGWNNIRIDVYAR